MIDEVPFRIVQILVEGELAGFTCTHTVAQAAGVAPMKRQP